MSDKNEEKDFESFKNSKYYSSTLGKSLSHYLRHDLLYFNDSDRVNEYVKISALLERLKKDHPTFLPDLDGINKTIETDKKDRFERKTIDNTEYLRCVQGWNVKFIDIVKDIGEEINIDWCIHGAYLKDLDSIHETGLNRMERTHIHLANGITDLCNKKLVKLKRLNHLLNLINVQSINIVKSGCRHDVEVLIIIDSKQAIEDGYKFYKSKNNVILTDGKNGIIETKYLKYFYLK